MENYSTSALKDACLLQGYVWAWVLYIRQGYAFFPIIMERFLSQKTEKSK